MKTESNNEEMSLSKQRKLARKKEIVRQKRNAVIAKVVAVLVVLAIIGVVVLVVLKDQAKKDKQVTADSNFSAQLDDNGKIKDIKASDYITMADYNNITASLSDIEYADDKVESDIQTILENNKVLNESAELEAKDGDKVKIDYAGTVDGVAFDSGTAEDQDIVLGSGSLIDTFEQQIVGHKPGDAFDVNVTFPEDYGTVDLAGKAAVFAVTLKGIYVKPEFTDEFVAEKLSQYATTAEGYRQYLKDTNYKTNLSNFVSDYVVENTTLKDTPKAYQKQLKSNFKATEQSYYEYYNQMYLTYLGSAQYTSFEDYLSKTYEMTEEQYDESLDEKVTNDLKFALFCQAVAEAEGITATLDEAKQYYVSEGGTEEDFDSQVTTYGNGYMVQNMLKEKVINMICDKVKVQ